jgi:hypothetical protein
MATKGIALRKWSLSASDYENEAEFRAAVQNELASFEHIGERLGIGVIAAPIRTRALPERRVVHGRLGLPDRDRPGRTRGVGDRGARGRVADRPR